MLEKHTTEVLSEKEMEALQMMESFTDEAINKQFGKSYSINVDANAIDKLASGFGIYRRSILIDKWKSMCENAGWEVKYSSGQMSNDWILTGKNK